MHKRRNAKTMTITAEANTESSVESLSSVVCVHRMVR